MDDSRSGTLDDSTTTARNGHDTYHVGGNGPGSPKDGGGRRGPGMFPVILIAAIVGLAGGVGGYFIADAANGDSGASSSKDSGSSTSTPASSTKSSSTKASGAGGTSPSSSSGSMSAEAIYKQAAPGVVHITSTQIVTSQSLFDFGQQREAQASGSGFVIDTKGHIVTNAHVVDGAQKITVSFSENHEIPAKLVGEDVSSDLAVLSVDPGSKELKNAGLQPLELGDSTSVTVGDPVYAIGNPFNLDRTLTAGIVSALARKIQATNGFSIDHVIQTDAPINPGNSGGPLLDANGKVIGVNSQIASPVQSSSGEGQNAGIGFAIPSNTITRVTSQLIDKGSVKHAFLGVVGGDLDGSVADIPGIDFPVKRGVLIGRVTKGSPADKAGLKGGTTDIVVGGHNLSLGGDIITKFDGTDVTSMTQLSDLVNGKSAGDKVEVTFYRGTSKKTVTVTLGNRPDQQSGTSSSSDGTQ